MIALLLLAAHIPPGDVSSASIACVPAPSGETPPKRSAIAEHRSLRQALGEPLPQAAAMVLLHGKGGHLSTEEYSIVLARSDDGAWRGTAVGRSQIWVQGAPYTPMDRAEWVLDMSAAHALDEAIVRPCRKVKRPTDASPSEPPPRGTIFETIDIVRPGHGSVAFDAQDGGIGALIRPPR